MWRPWGIARRIDAGERIPTASSRLLIERTQRLACGSGQPACPMRDAYLPSVEPVAENRIDLAQSDAGNETRSVFRKSQIAIRPHHNVIGLCARAETELRGDSVQGDMADLARVEIGIPKVAIGS